MPKIQVLNFKIQFDAFSSDVDIISDEDESSLLANINDSDINFAAYDKFDKAFEDAYSILHIRKAPVRKALVRKASLTARRTAEKGIAAIKRYGIDNEIYGGSESDLSDDEDSDDDYKEVQTRPKKAKFEKYNKSDYGADVVDITRNDSDNSQIDLTGSDSDDDKAFDVLDDDATVLLY